MTILNTGHVSFSGLDFSNIQVSTLINNKWLGPNIAGGIFGGTNLEKADLRGSLLFGSWFQKSNMKGCKFSNPDLGIAKKTFKGHTDWVKSVSISSDGKFIASGSDDQTVKLWSVETGKMIKEFKGHTSHVDSVSISSDGKFIASGSEDNTVK